MSNQPPGKLRAADGMPLKHLVPSGRRVQREGVQVPDTHFPPRSSGPSVVVAPAEIDVSTAEQLRVALLRTEGHLAGKTRSVVVVDLTHTLFCDSTGLTVLLRAHRRVVADGGEFRLVIPAKGAVARVFALSGMDHVISCFASVERALGSWSAATASVSVN